MGTVTRDVTGGCKRGLEHCPERRVNIKNWREKSETGKTSEKMGKPSEFGD